MSGGFRLGLPAGLALILITNLVVFTGVASNRRGEPNARMTLSERELHLWRAYDYDYENSGISLDLDWGRRRDWEGYDWLTHSKLTELGFDLSVDPSDEEAKRFYRDPLPIEAWIALEFDGPAWQRYLEARRADIERYLAEESGNEESSWRAERAQAALAIAERMGSRLVVVDAELDPDSLHERYPKKDRYFVLRSELGIRFHQQPGEIVGYVSSPLITSIHVPRPYSSLLDELDDTHDELLGPRYEVVLTFGSRSEPWIEDLRMSPASQ